MDRLQREMNRLFAPLKRTAGRAADDFPAVNVWTSQDNALLTAELPGVDKDQIEVTVKDDTVTIRGTREPDELKQGEGYLRHERGTGNFVRAFALPFHVDGNKVTAQYQKGILQLVLPRREEDKPRTITVKGG